MASDDRQRRRSGGRQVEYSNDRYVMRSEDERYHSQVDVNWNDDDFEDVETDFRNVDTASAGRRGSGSADEGPQTYGNLNRRSSSFGEDRGSRRSADFEEQRRAHRSSSYGDERDSRRSSSYGDERDSRRSSSYGDERDSRRSSSRGDGRSRRNESFEEQRRAHRNGAARREPEYDDRRAYEDDRDDRRRSGAEHDRRRSRTVRREERSGGRRKGGCGCGCAGCLVPLLVLVLVIGGVGYFGINFLWGRVQSPKFSASEVACNSGRGESTAAEDDQYEMIMLYGVDSRDQDPLKTGALADANILVAINKSTGEITMTSIYRDTYVETTDGEHMKLTEVYSKYGPKESLQTINKNLDLNVTEFITVTWASVAKAIDGLGGLDLAITAKEAAGINKYIDEVIRNTGISSEHVRTDISENGEVMHLDGVQAVTYCRLRKGLGDDYQRTVRQRTVISAAFAKAKSDPKSAAMTAYEILPMLASNLSTVRLMSLMLGLAKYDMGDNYGYPEYIGDDPSYVYPNTLLMNDEWLHETVFGLGEYQPSQTVEIVSDTISTKSGYDG